jgi:DNA (cytosine-5)-methyltransferase 1
MNQRIESFLSEEAMTAFELFDWWRPQQLMEEIPEMDLDRIKYLIRIRKEFVSAGKIGENTLTSRQKEILQQFPIRQNEIDQLKKLFPVSIDGDRFSFVDLFAGIGGIRKPFSEIGGKCVLTCEWDEYAQKTYKANWKSCPEHKFLSDIKDATQPMEKKGKELLKTIDKKIPDHDVLLAGFPCQPFSIAGVSKKNALNRAHGFECEDQGQLFFDICRILTAKQPPIAILENVKNLKSHDGGKTFQVIKDTLSHLPDHQTTLFKDEVANNLQSYWIANLDDDKPDPKVIDAKRFIPQHRERIVLVCIRKDIALKLNLEAKLNLKNIETPSKKKTLKDILDANKSVDKKYTLSPKLWGFLEGYAKKHKAKGNGFGFGMVTRNTKDVTRTLSARYYKDGSEILINQDDIKKTPRRLTPQECARLMGFVDKNSSLNIPVSDTRAYKQFGNSVVVPVFEAVAKILHPYIEEIRNIN